MPDSDEDYVQYSDDDLDAHNVGGKAAKSGNSGRGNRPHGSRTGSAGASGVKRVGGFEVSRTWEALEEGADGTISGAVEGLLEASKRKRVPKDTTPLQRGIIRHLIITIDLSSAMSEKDLRPTRYLLTIQYVTEFVREYFEQNPISQLGIIGLRDGLAIRVSNMSGNPEEHVAALRRLKDQEPKGDQSLQNGLEMARAALFNAPSHGTREVLILSAAILTNDPGDIHDTIKALVSANITCTVIGLAAEMAICRTLVTRTNPSANSKEAYSVALDEVHYRELLMKATTPPPIAPKAVEQHAEDNTGGELLQFGFPSLVKTPPDQPSLCSCHGTPTVEGYSCPRCSAKVCSLPCECRICGMTLILSTHLARSYHHLFPLNNWVEVSWAEARTQNPHQPNCFSCQTPFPPIPKETQRNKQAATASNKAKGKQPTSSVPAQAAGGVAQQMDGSKATSIAEAHAATATNPTGYAESGRYNCTNCTTHFCSDCDVFNHEFTHNCPGCLSKGQAIEAGLDVQAPITSAGGMPKAAGTGVEDPMDMEEDRSKYEGVPEEELPGEEINRQMLELLIQDLGRVGGGFLEGLDELKAIL